MTRQIGAPVSRLDGPAKVTGRARYTADTPEGDAAFAVIVPAARPHAKIVAIGLPEGAPGVVRIFTHKNAPRLGKMSVPLTGEDALPLQDDRVLYEGQPVALVVAGTLEQAEDAARQVVVTYEALPFEADFLALAPKATEAAATFFGIPPDRSKGSVAAAWSGAAARLERTYLTADRHHNPLETCASVAAWRDGKLFVYDNTQSVTDARACLAQALQIDEALIRVKNEFIGGAFGSKGWGWPYQVLAAMAARELGRAVRLVLSRAASYTGHGYQPATRQTVALSARGDGTLTGIRHDTAYASSFIGDYVEGAGWDTPALYASPSFQTTHRVVRLHRGPPQQMRAPAGGIGLVAVEIAMDELAYELKIDPLALRLKNYAEVDPLSGRPFSSKKLRECYELGAERFGWSRRPHAPRSLRRGRDLVGHGMASVLVPAFRFSANARVSVDRAGGVLVETGAHDIGQGLATILPQIAADVLGLPAARVTLAWGDTTLPVAPMTAGSTTTMSVGSAVRDGALKLRDKLARAGGAAPADYPQALARLGVDRLAAEGSWAPNEAEPPTPIYSFGAVFAEVSVDEDLLVPRVRRVVGVYSAGNIINPKTARSQLTGGIIWGIGQALLERSEVDPRAGRFLSKNLSGYLVPANADVPDIDASFVEEFDAKANPLGARGIGELGAIGIGAAIANAVFHATGVRVREVPIRPEHLL